jgi:protein JSN1
LLKLALTWLKSEFVSTPLCNFKRLLLIDTIDKNGTWAGQKIIDVAKTPAQMNKICDCLRPYTVALFLDQYGNYVLQCCLRFAAPWNDFIFETMLGRMWEIAQGRFGARAMRGVLGEPSR